MTYIVLVKDQITEEKQAYGMFRSYERAEAWTQDLIIRPDEIWSIVPYQAVE